MITTKTGDTGQTTCGNKRVDKDDLLVEVIGTIDELQAVLGIIKTKFLISNDQFLINEIQKDLVEISGELACGKKFENLENRIKEIEEEEKNIEKKLPELREFIIPGKNETEAFLNFGRTVCRRVERRVVTLNKCEKINPDVLKYFNRLSDYLFIISRTIE